MRSVIAVGVLSILVIVLILYIVILQLQLRSINRQLTKRLKEHTRQPIRLDLMNKELSALAINMNKCFKAEETLRLKAIREEKQFKEMIANISHDLRTPLTAIKGYQQLIANDILSREQSKRLEIARKHAEELERLIESFFEYSYLLNAETVPQIERINLTNLVAECLVESIEVLEEKNMSVEYEETQPIFVSADKEMTVRIIRNLLRNCMQHSKGNIKVQIFMKKNAVLSFQNHVSLDTSIDVKRLFDRFYTADKARSKSTGMGLSIVKLLAEQMGGCTDAVLQEGLLEIIVELPLYSIA
ncbi:MAG: histidine kinase [Herbinix sp.]|jgi:signal transduction histidine kinase|nr:histidine kinase [Herbinix sp.]